LRTEWAQKEIKMTKQMMNISDFHKMFLGFDRMTPDFFSNDPMTGYPRYNVVKAGTEGYRVEVAVPGWDKDDIEITFDKNELRIEGTSKQEAAEDEEYVYKGLSGKTFTRVFKVGSNIKLDTAYMKNGLLCVELYQEVPEEEKARVVQIHDA
jgi:molecular chaperone IbpA